MERQVQIQLLERLLAHVQAGTTADAGGFFHNPVSVYTDPDVACRELHALFADYPQIIGLSGELPGPNTFVTIDDFGTPVLAVRDGNGQFAAYLNVCRHRGSTVETESSGAKARFTCPFHGWTYNNTGALSAVSRPGHFGEVDRACLGLVALPAEERHGFLWVHPNPDGVIDVDELLGGLGSDLDTWDWGRYQRVADDTYDLPLNWKLAIDTFGETYHFDELHKNTLRKAYFSSVQTSDRFGFNHRMMVCNRHIERLRDVAQDQWVFTNGAFPVYTLFPNVALTVTSHGVNMLRAYPVPGQPGRSISKITFYTDPDVIGLRDTALAERIAIYTAAVRDEDLAVAATAQRGAESGAQTHIVFGRNEPGLHHYHQSWREVMGEPPIELSDSAGSPS